MATKKTNKKNSYEKVIRTRNVNSWDNFSNLFKEEFFTMKNRALNNKLDLGDYVWRGHRRQDWKLLSSFDREFKTKSGDFVYVPDRETILKRHLNSFVYAIRSRLKEFGLNVREIKAAIKNNLFSTNHIWALGQHYGLKTPLLDWCYSPYVAAYFAFQEKKRKKTITETKLSGD